MVTCIAGLSQKEELQANEAVVACFHHSRQVSRLRRLFSLMNYGVAMQRRYILLPLALSGAGMHPLLMFFVAALHGNAVDYSSPDGYGVFTNNYLCSVNYY